MARGRKGEPDTDGPPRPVPTLQQLIDDFAAEGTVVVGEPDFGRMLITAYLYDPLDPPVRLVVTPVQFSSMLSASAADPYEDWAGEDPAEMAYWFVKDQFHAAFTDVLAEPVELMCRGDRVFTVTESRPRPGPLAGLDPDSEYEWRAERPGPG
jgi:hypothetical protein